MVKKRQTKFGGDFKKETGKRLREYKSELRTLARYLRAVDNRRGFFPIVFLKNEGLIKKHVLKKGKRKNGGIVGRKEIYVLTPHGKKMLTALSQLGY